MAAASIEENGRPVLNVFVEEVGRFRYTYWRNVTIGIWSDQATLQAVQKLWPLVKHLLVEYPGGHSNIAFALDGAPAPTPEAQAELARIFDAQKTRLACTAVIVEGTGFEASALHSSVTSARLTAPGPMRLRLHRSIDEVVNWLPAMHRERTGVEINAGDLRQVLQAARALGTGPREHVALRG